MNEDLLNILANSNKDLDNQKLMDYLSGKLSQEEKHEVEKSMADSEFMNDAVEGLNHLSDAVKLQAHVEQLNKGLQKHLEKTKLRRKNRRLKENPWVYLAIILTLMLCIIAYVVIRQYLK
jgi:anti-sigma factor RsiW